MHNHTTLLVARDLAARNCLVGDGDLVKIAGFGMCRWGEEGIYMVPPGTTKDMPIKWTAPEVHDLIL